MEYVPSSRSVSFHVSESAPIARDRTQVPASGEAPSSHPAKASAAHSAPAATDGQIALDRIPFLPPRGDSGATSRPVVGAV